MKSEVIQLWLDAEEENRKGNELECIRLKTQFSIEFSKLCLDDKKYVNEYLEDVAA